MDTLYVRPAEGRRVRLPESGEPMPPEGMEVSVDVFWRRRLDDGDVVQAKAPREPKKEA